MHENIFELVIKIIKIFLPAWQQAHEFKNKKNKKIIFNCMTNRAMAHRLGLAATPAPIIKNKKN
jgi:hypothetical protein